MWSFFGILYHFFIRTVFEKAETVAAQGVSCFRRLFPLDRRGWFASDVVHHAVDARHFAGDAVRDSEQQRMGETGVFAGHKVVGAHGADGQRVFVGAEIAHHADGAHVGEHAEILIGPDAAAADLLARGRNFPQTSMYLGSNNRIRSFIIIFTQSS